MEKECPHRRRRGNSEGEVCMDCGKITAGYGPDYPYAKTCIHSAWAEADQPKAMCCYCYDYVPNPNYKPVFSVN